MFPKLPIHHGGFRVSRFRMLASPQATADRIIPELRADCRRLTPPPARG